MVAKGRKRRLFFTSPMNSSTTNSFLKSEKLQTILPLSTSQLTFTIWNSGHQRTIFRKLKNKSKRNRLCLVPLNLRQNHRLIHILVVVSKRTFSSMSWTNATSKMSKKRERIFRSNLWPQLRICLKYGELKTKIGFPFLSCISWNLKVRIFLKRMSLSQFLGLWVKTLTRWQSGHKL